MTHTKIRELKCGAMSLLLTLLCLFSVLMPMTSISVKAEEPTDEPPKNITVEQVVENTIFIVFKKYVVDGVDRRMIACFYFPDTVYDPTFEYGVVIFPRTYPKQTGIKSNYIEEYEKIGKLNSILVVESTEVKISALDGKIIKCGIAHLGDNTVKREMSFIFYARDSTGKAAYLKPKHVVYNKLNAKAYSDAEIIEMARQKIELEKRLKAFVEKVEELIDAVWIYLVIAGGSVVTIWGAYIGIKVAVAKKNEEQINARGMVKSLIIGTVVIFVFAVAAPLLIKGLVTWLYW